MMSIQKVAGIPRGLVVWWVILVSITLASLTFSAVGQAPSVSGQLGLITVDTPDGARLEWTLYLSDGVNRRVDISDEVLAAAGGLRAITGQWVSITSDALPTRGGAMVARSITPSSTPRGFSPFSVDPGPAAHWLNLPCKFSDVATEPATVSEIEAIFGSDPERVAESYDALSRGKHTFTSTTYDWATLPHTLNYYQTVNNLNDDMYKDCRAAHGLTAGARNVNLLFNVDHMNGAAAGGQTFDGNNLVRATWLPPHAWHNIDTIVHEIGHGYGMPHSDNSNNDPNTYDNPWDIMSGGNYYADYVDGLGYMAAPHNTYHVYKVGWLDADETVTIPAGSTQTVTIDHWGVDDSANAYAALIPLDYTDPNRATKLYVVEVRRGAGDAGNHQKHLPDADGVLIYVVDTMRKSPAHLVGQMIGGLDNNAVFTVGESFTDATQMLTISVTGATTDGYTVQIQRGVPPAVTPEPTSSVSGTADLKVTVLEAVASPVYDDGRVEVTFEARNVGTTPTSGAQLSVDFSEVMFETPDDHGFLWGYSGTAPVVSYGRLDNGIYIRADTIAPNSYIRVTVKMYPDASDNGVWTMRAVATHAKTEMTPADNTATHSILVLPTPESEVAGASLLTNPAFDASSTRDLSGWALKRASGTPNNDKLACDDPLNNKFFSRSAPCAFRFTGNANENSILSQTVVLTSPVVTADSAIVLSAWVKSAKVPTGAAKLKATISFSGTTKKQNLTVTLPTSTGGVYRRVLSKPAILKYPNPMQVVISVMYKAQTTSAKLWIDDISAVLTP